VTKGTGQSPSFQWMSQTNEKHQTLVSGFVLTRGLR
jgi:hypothetical protein